jgi:hypothetical protein
VPRPTKMGTIVSPRRHDAAAETAIKATIARGGCQGYAPTFGLRRSGAHGILCHRITSERGCQCPQEMSC